MPLAGACHPEWGYLAPAPNFLRTARIFIIAAAIGAMASAAIFCSLIYRPAAETSVAEQTLVHAVDPTAGAGRMEDALPPQPHSERCLVLEPRRAADAGATPLQSDAASGHARSGSPAPAGVGGTLSAHHASVAASPAQSPKIMATETLTARASADERATVTSEAASALRGSGSRARSRGLPRTYTLRLATNPGPTRASADLTGSRSGYGSYGGRDY
jgi:hypothetical protein